VRHWVIRTCEPSFRAPIPWNTGSPFSNPTGANRNSFSFGDSSCGHCLSCLTGITFLSFVKLESRLNGLVLSSVAPPVPSEAIRLPAGDLSQRQNKVKVNREWGDSDEQLEHDSEESNACSEADQRLVNAFFLLLALE
jgi:hypothetical protein